MGKSFNATVEVKCWKRHSCLGCGSKYSYVLERSVTGSAGTAAAAERNAEHLAEKALDNDVDKHPCPECGIYQPDMVGQSRRTGHWVVFVSLLVALTGVILLGSFCAISYDLAAIIGGVIVVAGLAADCIVARMNPNRNPEANREIALGRIEAGEVRLDAKGKGPEHSEAPPSTAFGGLNLFGSALIVLGGLAIVNVALLRSAAGWPLNRDHYPAVAGPGDTVTIYLPQRFEAVKGYWAGTPTAKVVNDKEVGRPAGGLKAVTQRSSWGDNISISSKESKTKTVKPWIEVTIPNQAELAGKTLEIQLNLKVVYPAMRGHKQFEEERQEINHTAQIALASPSAGSKYQMSWFLGAFGGLGLVLLGAFLFVAQAKRVARQALPTETEPFGRRPPPREYDQGEHRGPYGYRAQGSPEVPEVERADALPSRRKPSDEEVFEAEAVEPEPRRDRWEHEDDDDRRDRRRRRN